MFNSNRVMAKFKTSFPKLKKELIWKELLSQYMFSSGLLVKKENEKLNTLFNKKSDATSKADRQIYRQPVDCAKVKTNSNNFFTAIVPYLAKNSKTISFCANDILKMLSHNFLMSRGYSEHLMNNCSRTCINSAKYCTCPAKPPCGVGRHCYHEETENAINQQILAELNACYAYLSMACYFGRTEIALPGCQGFFMKMHKEEHIHALTFINYQLMRGGHVKLCPLTIPDCQNWESIHKALAVAVELEKLVKEKLVHVYDIAEKHRDLHIMDLITTKFMEEQERSICEISRLLMRATYMGCSGMAQYLFDKEVHRAFVKKSSKNKDLLEDTHNKFDVYI